MIPLDFREEIEITDIKDIADYKERLLRNMADELKNVKASEIDVRDNELTFHVAFFRLVSNWNILTQINSGNIKILSSSKNVVVSYYISFTRMFIIVSVMTAFFGIFLSQDKALSTNEKIILPAAAWLFLFGANWLTAMFRFPSFIEDIIRKTNR